MTTVGQSSPRPDQRAEPIRNRAVASEPPRHTAARDALADRFASRLKGESEGRHSGRISGEAGLPPAGQRAKDFEQSNRHEGELADGAKAEIARQLSSEASGRMQASSQVLQADRAIIDRMAAQIAEGRGIGAAQQAEISFPLGALAQSALVTRIPDGGMAIRIVGLDQRLGAFRTARAKLGLLAALGRRDVRVASLVFEQPVEDGAQRAGREPTISRVV